MLCDPGYCTTMDSTYLDIVRNALPAAYLSPLSNNDLFGMARDWCRTVNEPGGWDKIKEFIQSAYDKGIRNDYNLYVWTLVGSSGYCFDKTDEIRKYVESLRQL
jgi:hypothetical protein